MSSKKKDGCPNTKYYDSQDTIQMFEPIRNWLNKFMKKYSQVESFTNKYLSNLCLQLLQFQEDAFGKNAKSPALTKIPIKCFQDLKPGGGLCHILGTIMKYKIDQGLRRFDFQNPSRMDRNVEMFMLIEKALVQNGCLTRPVIYLTEGMSEKTRSKLNEIICEHQGSVTDDRTEATHIVCPSPDGFTSDDYISVIEKKEKFVLVHHWYYPDSYDSWTPVNEAATDHLSPTPPHQGVWRVHEQWVLDLDCYNEWMNEFDYEITDDNGMVAPVYAKRKGYVAKGSKDDSPTSSDGDRRRVLSKKRSKQRSPSPEPQKKKTKKGRPSTPAAVKKKSSKDEEVEDPTKDMDEPATVPKVEEVLLPKQVYSKRDLETQPIKGGNIQEIGEAEDTEPMEQNVESENGKELATIKSDRDPTDETVTEQTHHIIVPSYSAWFDYNSIHAIEKRALPEFFNGKNKSKTPEIYLAYRNFMLDTYRLNPMEYLSATACRRNLAGDVCAIIRVHAFMEMWGLVNYQVDTDSKPSLMGPPPTSHFHVIADTPSGMQPMAPAKISLTNAQQVSKFDSKETTKDEKSTTVEELGTNLGLKTDLYAPHQKMAKPKTVAAAAVAKPWTDQEILLLLEGLEMYKDDWNKVSEHVSSRTQDECILQFLRLPIEDPYLEGTIAASAAEGESNSVDFKDIIKNQPVPFSKAGNPVMSTVAFLASVVSPRVAAAAAKAAIEEFTKMKDEVPKRLIDAHVREVEAAAKEGIVDPAHGLNKSGIAGTEPEKAEKVEEKKTDEKKDEKTAESKESDEKTEKKDEAMETDSPEKKEEKTGTEEVSAETSQDKKDGKATAEEEKAKAEKVKEFLNKNIPEGNLASAAASALAAAAVKAKYLAQVEERKIKSLVALLVETQMKKLEIKLRHVEDIGIIQDCELARTRLESQQLLKERQTFIMNTAKHFEELETIMERERQQLEYQRQQLMQERQAFLLEQMRYAEARARQQQVKHMHLMQQQQQQTGSLHPGAPPHSGVPPTQPGQIPPPQSGFTGQQPQVGHPGAPPQIPSSQPPQPMMTGPPQTQLPPTVSTNQQQVPPQMVTNQQPPPQAPPNQPFPTQMPPNQQQAPPPQQYPQQLPPNQPFPTQPQPNQQIAPQMMPNQQPAPGVPQPMASQPQQAPPSVAGNPPMSRPVQQVAGPRQTPSPALSHTSTTSTPPLPGHPPTSQHAAPPHPQGMAPPPGQPIPGQPPMGPPAAQLGVPPPPSMMGHPPQQHPHYPQQYQQQRPPAPAPGHPGMPPPQGGYAPPPGPPTSIQQPGTVPPPMHQPQQGPPGSYPAPPPSQQYQSQPGFPQSFPPQSGEVPPQYPPGSAQSMPPPQNYQPQPPVGEMQPQPQPAPAPNQQAPPAPQ
ncbi:SWI/SNF complex subunit SMARCC2-like isoform X1 [Styela clava]